MELPERALIITPHPDDAEITCGGTVANWVREGVEVYYVLCSDGSKGSEDPDMSPQRLASIRREEQLDAAAHLGVKQVITLGFPDGELEDTPEFRCQLVTAIRRFRPDVVIAPDPHRRSFYFHRDHRITGQVAQDAVFPYARDRLHFPELLSQGLEPHKVGTMLFWGPELADTYIDITDTIDVKIEALLCHKSQISGLSEGEESNWLRNWCREEGEKAGYQYAEAYRKVEFHI